MIPLCEKLRLLIVMEDAFARDVLAAAAESSGMFGAIRGAEDVHEALAQVWDGVQRQALPDVIVADLDLADGNGPQFAGELRRNEETRAVFIALVAEAPNDLGRAAAEAAGADCFGLFSTSVEEMSEVLGEIARRSIAAGRVPIS